MSTNFVHLRSYDEQLFRLGSLAERYFPEDPNTALIKLRSSLKNPAISAIMGQLPTG